MGFGATILRPTNFIDNEVMVKDVILNHGVYDQEQNPAKHRAVVTCLHPSGFCYLAVPSSAASAGVLAGAR